MKIIKLNNSKQVFYIDNCDFKLVSKYEWNLAQNYPQTRVGQHMCFAHRLILNLGYGNKTWVDHKDHNRFNNQRSNLRLCNPTQSNANIRKREGTMFKYKGAFLISYRWRSYITFKRKVIHLGYFDTEIQAAKQYDKAARILFGQFACLNFPNC